MPRIAGVAAAAVRATHAAPSQEAASVLHWQQHVEAGDRVAELVEQLSGDLAGLPAGHRLQALVRQLEHAIAECDAAAWRAIKALDRESRRA